MIEFYGELSDKCQIARAKKIAKCNGVLFLTVSIIIIIPIIIWATITSKIHYALILMALFTIMIGISFAVPQKRSLSFKIPTRLIIDANTISTTALGGKESMKTKPLVAVKKVFDRGEWYDIIFKYGNMSNSWVCQKDLIKKGTIDEFEKIFKNKIIIF